MLEAPSVVGDRYRVGRLIAASGMADVYAAVDERLDRPVALKFLRAEGPTDAARFRREMATLARLEHPNLVRLYDADVYDTIPYLVLELVDGPSLAGHLTDHGPLDSTATARLLGDLASALAYVHSEDVVHRDMKPSNVLLDPDGNARLTDFGIARSGDATAMTGTAMTIGTAAYLAPEQARGEPVTASADVYSLGLVLLECLTGVRAFPGPPVEAAVARLSRDPDIPASLDPAWRRLLGAMTSRQADARPSAASLVDAAVGMGQGGDATETVPMTRSVAATSTLPVAAPAPSSTAALDASARPAPVTRERDTTPRNRRQVIAALAVAGLLAVLGLGFLSAQGADDWLRDNRAAATATVAPVTTAPTTLPPTTLPPATALPTTVAPAVAAPAGCSALEAQKRTLDDQKKALGGGKDADKSAREALDAKKKEVDAALKACKDG